MANLLKLVPFIMYYEAGGSRRCFVYSGNPRRLVKYDPSLISYEEQYKDCTRRGYANDPDDRGGATMCGVTIGTYSDYCRRRGKTATVEALRNLQYSEWYDILKTLYWNRWKADEIENQSVANILVDWVWGSGITGIKRAQRILGVNADGIVGPKTLKAVNESDPKVLFSKIHDDRLKHFNEIVGRSPSQRKFLKGWRRRVNAITYEGLKYI